ncbi:fertilin alpha subunit, putative [Trichomonas vaginalis G3]|uniref:Fertilin alpha subunit, putative n=1 Tax=Trichomonas vaginalis (strain ATCC PRA-98 / G3) TaxID=412133 RepID=A2DA26_TRIV3|nr:hypothetical protein TVAGG3_0266010 [Trichomonas vaginalis G3]EAY22674.1 fertilin alpha subunit, putative [Trichomonas vaginalis G3]KAI5525488.1 hypothetical protein TVAGG3_0266010 [Trichomonas vaginalis G3]|eukprot:XP_001583660.1 fertilin alpha subunit [Trichomonas vaginalis G3]
MVSQIDQLKNCTYSSWQREFKVKSYIYKVPKYFCLAGKSLYVKFWSSCFGRVFLAILKCIGLAIIVENLFIIFSNYQKVIIKRKVSNSQSGKFTPYQPVPDTLKSIDHDEFMRLDDYLRRVEEAQRSAPFPGSDFNYAMPPQQPYPTAEAYPPGAYPTAPQQPYPTAPQQPYPTALQQPYPTAPQQPYPQPEGGPYYGAPPPPQQQPPIEENLAGPTPPPPADLPPPPE